MPLFPHSHYMTVSEFFEKFFTPNPSSFFQAQVKQQPSDPAFFYSTVSRALGRHDDIAEEMACEKGKAYKAALIWNIEHDTEYSALNDAERQERIRKITKGYDEIFKDRTSIRDAYNSLMHTITQIVNGDVVEHPQELGILEYMTPILAAAQAYCEHANHLEGTFDQNMPGIQPDIFRVAGNIAREMGEQSEHIQAQLMDLATADYARESNIRIVYELIRYLNKLPGWIDHEKPLALGNVIIDGLQESQTAVYIPSVNEDDIATRLNPLDAVVIRIPDRVKDTELTAGQLQQEVQMLRSLIGEVFSETPYITPKSDLVLESRQCTAIRALLEKNPTQIAKEAPNFFSKYYTPEGEIVPAPEDQTPTPPRNPPASGTQAGFLGRLLGRNSGANPAAQPSSRA